MLSFKQYIKESEETPYGVLFLKNKEGEDTHAIVGTPHHDSPEMPDHVMERINKIRKKHGIYYEGDGGDVKYHEHLFGPKKSYSGTWQGTPINRENPPDWIHTPLFSNHKENNAVERIMAHHKPGDTISDTIRRSGYNLATYETGEGRYQPTEEHLHNFFHKLGMSSKANKPTTQKSLSNFLNTGEKKIWPNNWLVNKSPGPTIARKMVYARQNNIFDRPGGVFVAGAGHVPAAKQRASDTGIEHEMIGGSKAN